MAVQIPKKKPNKTIPNVSSEESEALANEMADRPYGNVKDNSQVVVKDPHVKTSISLPKTRLHQLQKIVMDNKQNGGEFKSVSSIIQTALDQYFSSK